MPDGVHPTVWGKRWWKSTEALINACTTAEMLEAVLAFIKQTALFLPCEMCRDNYAKHLKKILPAARVNTGLTRRNLHHLWWQIHNAVNECRGVASYSWDDYQRYNMTRAALH